MIRFAAIDVGAEDGSFIVQDFGTDFLQGFGCFFRDYLSSVEWFG